MFWKAGLKITSVYKEPRVPLSLTLARAGRWAPGRAGGSGPARGRVPVPGPRAGNHSQAQRPEASWLPKRNAELGRVGVPALNPFFSGIIRGERTRQAQGLAVRVQIPALPPAEGSRFPHL